MRLSKSERKFRLARFIFGDLKESITNRKGRKTYSGKWALSVSLWAKLIHWEKGCKRWALTLLGVRVHLKHGLGGRCV